MFVSRLSPNGNALLYSTFFGGSLYSTIAKDLVLDPAGSAVFTGSTTSPNLPTTPGAFDVMLSTGLVSVDSFVARLSLAGNGAADLLYSTYLGGSFYEEAQTVALGPGGRITVAGETNSQDFPITPGAFDPTYLYGPPYPSGWPADVYLARLDPGLAGPAQLVYSTYVSTNVPPLTTFAATVAVESTGDAIVYGETISQTFPVTPGVFQPILGGGFDAFVARFSCAGNGPADLVFSTFLGGPGWEGSGTYQNPGRLLALDPSGGITLAGIAPSGFPTTPGAYDTTFNGGDDIWLARLSPSAGALLYSTYFGDTGSDRPKGLAIGSGGSVILVGSTDSPSFPTTPGAYDTTYNGPFVSGGDAFVATFDLPAAGTSLFGTSTLGCTGPLSIDINSIPQVGNAAFALTCTRAPANATGLLGLSASAAPSLVLGAQIWIDLLSPAFFGIPAASNALGLSQVPIPIPIVPSLGGGQAFAQFAWLDACAPGGVSASNAIALTVQP
jgi:hypothetical protein